MNTNKKLIVVSGGKGGVGKSTITLGVADALLARGETVTLVETDDSNPDVAKTLAGADNVSIEVANIDDESGFIRAANAIERADPASAIIINTPARGLTPLLAHWMILEEVAAGSRRDIIVLFPLNRQRDSVELLRQQIDGVNGTPVYATLNTYFGASEKFTLFHGSKVKSDCPGVVVWPEINDAIADTLTNDRIRLDDVAGRFTIAERSAIRRYRESVVAALSGVVT